MGEPIAVLQLEVPRSHAGKIHVKWAWDEATKDVLENGGTLVLVVSPKTVTMVQRRDASDFEEPPA